MSGASTVLKRTRRRMPQCFRAEWKEAQPLAPVSSAELALLEAYLGDLIADIISADKGAEETRRVKK